MDTNTCTRTYTYTYTHTHTHIPTFRFGDKVETMKTLIHAPHARTFAHTHMPKNAHTHTPRTHNQD